MITGAIMTALRGDGTATGEWDHGRCLLYIFFLVISSMPPEIGLGELRDLGKQCRDGSDIAGVGYHLA